MSEDYPRCPRCGKRISSEMAVCPACGLEFVPHRARIRCNSCGRRIPADAWSCPRCGHDPHGSRLSRPTRVLLIAFCLLLALCTGWVAFRAVATNALSRALGLLEPTYEPTATAQVVYVVASPPVTPSSSVPTPTLQYPPTARGAKPVTATRPPQFPYPAPQVLSPSNTAVFSGGDANITLEWQPVSNSILRENEWYSISVLFTGRDGKLTTRTGWAKETRWRVPPAWWNDAAPDARGFQWNVTLYRVEGVDPFASPSRTPASPTSATRSFIWN